MKKRFSNKLILSDFYLPLVHIKELLLCVCMSPRMGSKIIHPVDINSDQCGVGGKKREAQV